MIGTSEAERTAEGHRDVRDDALCVYCCVQGGTGHVVPNFKTFLYGRTNCQYFSPPEDTPHHEGAMHRQNVPCRPNATGTTGTDPTRPPPPNVSDNRTGPPLGGEDGGQPIKVLTTTQQPHTRTHRNRANHDNTRPTGNKSRREQPTATKRGRPSQKGPPHNP